MDSPNRRPLYDRSPPSPSRAAFSNEFSRISMLAPSAIDEESKSSSLLRAKTYSYSQNRHSKHNSEGDDPDFGTDANVRRHQSLSVRPMRTTFEEEHHTSPPTSPAEPDSTWSFTPEEAEQFTKKGNSNGTGLETAMSNAKISAGIPDWQQAPQPKLSLFTDVKPARGPQSAAAFVKPIGHSFQPRTSPEAFNSAKAGVQFHEKGALTAVAGTMTEDSWRQQRAFITGQPVNPPSPESPVATDRYASNFTNGASSSTHTSATTFQPFTPNSPIRQQNYSQPSPQFSSPARSSGFVPPNRAVWPPPTPLVQAPEPPRGSPLMTSQAGIMALAAQKGYNPLHFDCKPRAARFCVIKSYTEEDIHKSIKYDIWSSTVLGNKRLDRVFREGASSGPVYLFFSVNGSGHFCGVAEMQTPVDETVDSKVWADDKWKGIFKVRWIFVKDIPNSALRHLRLANTAENKPVTSSRDTQEVPYEIGVQMLSIIKSYPSRTTLLEDFLFYEAQERSKELIKGQFIENTTHKIMTPAQVF